MTIEIGTNFGFAIIVCAMAWMLRGLVGEKT